jgi:hypothetical protein
VDDVHALSDEHDADDNGQDADDSEYRAYHHELFTQTDRPPV